MKALKAGFSNWLSGSILRFVEPPAFSGADGLSASAAVLMYRAAHLECDGLSSGAWAFEFSFVNEARGETCLINGWSMRDCYNAMLQEFLCIDQIVDW